MSSESDTVSKEVRSILHRSTPIAQRSWLRLKILIAFHALIGALLAIAAIRLKIRAGDPPLLEWVLLTTLILAWILPFPFFRRWAARLSHAAPCPWATLVAGVLAFAPLLQMFWFNSPPPFGTPFESIGILLAINGGLFLWILIAVACFLITEVPIEWGAWGILMVCAILMMGGYISVMIGRGV